MKSATGHFDQLNNLSHHAYGIVGTVETRDELISTLEKTHKISAQGNPDFYIRNYEVLTIDDAREVKSLHSSRPLTDEGSIKGNNGAGKKIFVLTMNGITIEAQNALLKLLEEPAEYVRFFLIIPSAHLLLPTVKSRLLLIQESNSSKVTGADLIKEAKAFIEANQAKRLEVVKALTDAISKENKTKQDAIDFVNAVQEVVYKEKGAKEGKLALGAIEVARNYLNDRAPSIKMLLEFVALNI
ncbi:MAG: hypothetical protein PHG25_03800 [Candidatus Pacebacteria bacterium]|nr:hypothetical protein [Candidatus Paceibacterota bacterium]